MERGRLFIISGPSGAGKGTLRKQLFKALPELVFSVSCTTRAPRPSEVPGRDYHFISDDEFQSLVAEDAFLEWAGVHGKRYGTRRADVEECLSSGRSMVLEIDEQGCAQVKARMPEAITIFIMPPSIAELERRLAGRGTEEEEQRKHRLNSAEKEIARAAEYEHIILNDDLRTASERLSALVESYLRP